MSALRPWITPQRFLPRWSNLGWTPAPRYLSEGSINPLDGQLASNVIDTCGHATSNGRVGNPFFCADILDFPVISIESDVDGLSLFRRQFSQGLADFFQNRFFRLILFCLHEQV